jgi:hypothetical protein
MEVCREHLWRVSLAELRRILRSSRGGTQATTQTTCYGLSWCSFHVDSVIQGCENENEAAAISLVEVYRKVPESGRQMKTTLNLEGDRIRFITKSSEVVELVTTLLPKKRK